MKKVFYATETGKMMRTENTILHGEVMVGESNIMFADSTDQFPPCTAGLFIYVDDADKRYHAALAEGAVALTPMSDQPYGRSGGVKDMFGNTWWITSL